MADISQTPANVLKSSSGNATHGLIAGSTLVAGKVVYADSTDSNKLKLADSNGTTPANSVTGMMLDGGGSGQPVSIVTEDPALNVGATLTAGDVIYLSDTPGGITATYADILSGSTVITLGVANTDGTLNFKPVVGGVKP